MKERPILFSALMVQAILEGRKTQTRRICKQQPGERDGWKRVPKLLQTSKGLAVKFSSEFQHGVASGGEIEDHNAAVWVKCPHGQPGDRLWVRETHGFCDECGTLNFRATNGPAHCSGCDQSLSKWKPSIFMFRENSRITLEVTEVRVQRLREISEMDAQAEGANPIDRPVAVDMPHRLGFCMLWDTINEKRGFGWDTNPWVWAITFKRIK